MATYTELMSMKLTPQYEIIQSMTIDELQSMYNEVQAAIKPLEKAEKARFFGGNEQSEERTADLKLKSKLANFASSLNQEIASKKYA